jgi:triacylglycerol esterase/lipase EstA (alpha/beta hydrolase family)
LLASAYVAPDNTSIGQIKSKVDTLENYDDTVLQGKVDALENYDDTTLQTKVDNIQTSIDNIPATDLTGIETDLEIINKGVQDASLFIPHTTNLN